MMFDRKSAYISLIVIALECITNFIKVRLLREELQLLQEQGSYVGEVIKVTITKLRHSD